MRTLKSWALDARDANGVTLTVDGSHTLKITVLEEALFRISLKKAGDWRLDRTWSIAPAEDVPFEGRARDDLSGFSLPDFTCPEGETLVIETAVLRLTVENPLTMRWDARQADGTWKLVAEERPTGAYMLGIRDHRGVACRYIDPPFLLDGLKSEHGRVLAVRPTQWLISTLRAHGVVELEVVDRARGSLDLTERYHAVSKLCKHCPPGHAPGTGLTERRPTEWALAPKKERGRRTTIGLQSYFC